MRAGAQWHWTVRYRHPIAAARVSAIVAGALTLTGVAQVLVAMTADTRTDEHGLATAALITAALTIAPLITAGFALLGIRRSARNHGEWLTETACWVAACDLIVLVLALRG